MEFALAIMFLAIGAVSGALIGAAFCSERKSRIKFDGEYLTFDGPLTPEMALKVKEAWREHSFDELRRLQ